MVYFYCLIPHFAPFQFGFIQLALFGGAVVDGRGAGGEDTRPM